MQHVEQLPFVLVDALDLNIEQCVGGHADAHVLLQPGGQPLLVGQLGLADCGDQGRVIQVGLQRLQLRQVAAPAAADARIEHGRERGVGLRQPAPGRDAVGLVVEALRPKPRKVGKDGLLHQLGMQGRHAIDRVAGQHRQVSHAHPAFTGLVNQRHTPHQRHVVPMLLGELRQKVGVDVKDDLQVARQHPAQHLHRPGLQRLMHQRVIGVREHALAQAPGIGPGQVVLVEQQAHQLGDGQHRVGVVEVDADLGAELVKRAVLAQVAAQQVLHAGADKEVLLVQAQFAPRGRGVVGVEHARHVFRLVLALHRRQVIAAVEGIEVDLFGGLGRPQAQRVGGLGAVTRNDGVVGHGAHVVAVHPLVAVAVAHHMTAELDAVVHLRPGKLPGVGGVEPVVGHLHLAAVHNGLPEHAVVVADAVAITRDAERGHRIQKTGRQPAQAAVAQSSIGLQLGHGVHVHAQFGQRLAHRGLQLQRNQRIAEGAPHQKLHRQVIDVFHVLGALGAGGAHPALHQLVAYRMGGSMQPVHGLGRLGVFANGKQQLVGNGALECRQVMGRGVDVKGGRCSRWQHGCGHGWG